MRHEGVEAGPKSVRVARLCTASGDVDDDDDKELRVGISRAVDASPPPGNRRNLVEYFVDCIPADGAAK